MAAARASRRGVGVVLLVAASLVVAVLLTRGSTATDVQLSPSPPPSTPDVEPPGGPPQVDADGVAGARLGQGLSANDERWSRGPDVHGSQGCTLVDPLSGVGMPGLQVIAWAVEGRLVSVVVTRPPGSVVRDVAVPHGLLLGDDLESATVLAGADVTTDRFDVPVGDGSGLYDGSGVGGEVREVRAVTVAAEDRETVYSDLGGDRGIVYVEVRDADAPDCRLDDPSTSFLPERPGELTGDGIGEARLGRPVDELVALGLVGPSRDDSTAPCAVHTATEAGWEVGVEQVSARDGVVVAVTARVARTGEGLAVGDPVTEVERLYPDAVLQPGLNPQFPTRAADLPGDRRVVVGTGPRAVVPSTVDSYLVAADSQVWSLVVEVGSCDG